MNAWNGDRLDGGLARLFGVSADDAGLQLDAIRTKAASKLADYGSAISELFASQSVPVPPPVQLSWWPEGSRIKVLGIHPDHQRIETLLNGHGELVQQFKELELLHEIVHNTELAGNGTTEGQHFNIGITSSGAVAFYTA